MRVAVVCESSGVVREAFRKRGHDAISCDLLPADDGSQHHYEGDALEFLEKAGPLDLIIAHPPCTYLCNSGVRWLYKDGKRNTFAQNYDDLFDLNRLEELRAAVNFFNDIKTLAQANNPHVKLARENPIMHRYASSQLGPPAQYVQPWWFGDEAFKATGLWLDRLPPLVPTNKLTPPKKGTPEHRRWSQVHMASPGPDRWKIRSKTYQGFANAMAEQWG